MNIKGEYRDVLSRNGTVIVDTRWKSNEIVDDYGRFLAALMKKAFEQKVGIEYIAVGSGSDNDCAVFKAKVEKFFDEWYNTGKSGHLKGDNYWVWAKKIDVDNIIYLDDEGKEVRDPDIFTNRLKIDVKFKKEEPSEDTLVFKEFALRGIDKKDDKSNTEKLFFINYVDHGRITKDKSTELTRSIKLTFPIEEKEVVS